jgi:hypothetical protein
MDTPIASEMVIILFLSKIMIRQQTKKAKENITVLNEKLLIELKL